MIFLSFDGFYSTANKLQPEHIDPLFPFEALGFVFSSSYSLPTIGYTSSIVGFPSLKLFLLLSKINLQHLPTIFPLLTLP
jgi:hypothetical protein